MTGNDALPMYQTFTVLGVYHDTGFVFHTYVEARTGHEAIERAAEESGFHSELALIAAFPGKPEVTFPCDSGNSAFACDYEEDNYD